MKSKLKQKFKLRKGVEEVINAPNMTAVRMIAPLVPPKVEYCPNCFMQLHYWRTTRGNEWFCPVCLKRVEL